MLYFFVHCIFKIKTYFQITVTFYKIVDVMFAIQEKCSKSYCKSCEELLRIKTRTNYS